MDWIKNWKIASRLYHFSVISSSKSPDKTRGGSDRLPNIREVKGQSWLAPVILLGGEAKGKLKVSMTLSRCQKNLSSSPALRTLVSYLAWTRQIWVWTSTNQISKIGLIISCQKVTHPLWGTVREVRQTALKELPVGSSYCCWSLFLPMCFRLGKKLPAAHRAEPFRTSHSFFLLSSFSLSQTTWKLA